MIHKKLFLSSCLLIGSLHAQNSLGIDVNNKDMEVLGSIDLNAMIGYADSTTYSLDINYLRSDSNNMTQFALLGQNSLQGVESLSFALGFGSVLASDFLAFPFILKSSYILPLIDVIPTTSLSTSFAYAPNVLATRDAKNYFEWRAEVDMELIYNVHLFAGYRYIDTEYETVDKTYNKSAYFGLKLNF